MHALWSRAAPKLWSSAAPTLWWSAIVAVAVAIVSTHDDLLTIMLWVLLILALDLLASTLMGFGSSVSDTRCNLAMAAIGCCTIVTGAALAAGQGFTMAAGFLLVMVPGFRAGQVRGRVGAAVAVAAALVVFAGLTLARGTLTGADLVHNLPWAVLALGLLYAPAAHMGRWAGQRAVTPAVHEAANLLRRLSDLAGALDGGFDAPAAAELILHELKGKIPGGRMAVLVGVGSEPAVPLALRGIDRLPWPSPTTADSVIGRVWRTNVAEAGMWTSVNEDRAIAAAPLCDPDGARIGMVIIDRFAHAPFDDDDLRALVAVAESHSPDLDVALIFVALRQHAAFEERERLAREMHDGIAEQWRQAHQHQAAVLGWGRWAPVPPVTYDDAAVKAWPSCVSGTLRVWLCAPIKAWVPWLVRGSSSSEPLPGSVWACEPGVLRLLHTWRR